MINHVKEVIVLRYKKQSMRGRKTKESILGIG